MILAPFVRWMLNVALLLTLVMAVFAIGPLIETRFNPVYSKFKVVRTEYHGATMFVTFEYTKYRDCEPLEASFYFTDAGGLVKMVDARSVRRPGEGPKPLGRQVSAPWKFQNITELELASRVAGVIYSRCHPLWMTKSIIYP